MSAESNWSVYVLRSRDHSRTYVGISTDPQRRLHEHNGREAGGARATRAGRPWELAVLYGPYESRGDALRAEYELKRRRGGERLVWEPLPPARREVVE